MAPRRIIRAVQMIATAEAEKAEWKTTQDIKQRFPSADFLSDNRVIFNIKGNKHRLVVQVRYQNRSSWNGSVRTPNTIKSNSDL